eukprot:339082_1
MSYFLQLFSLLIIGITSTSTKIPEKATAIKGCGGDIPMEYAQITFNAESSLPIYIYGISDECDKCLHLPLNLNNLHDGPICVFIDTNHPFTIGYSTETPFQDCIPKFNKTNGKTCAWQPKSYIFALESYHYNQYEHYTITIEQTKAVRITTKTAPNKYIPLYVALLVLIFIIISYNVYQLYLKNTCSGGTDDSQYVKYGIESRENKESSS